MIQVREKLAKESDTDEDIDIVESIKTIAYLLEKNLFDSDYEYNNENADEYLKAFYLYLTDNLNKEIITSTTDIISLINFFFVAIKSAEAKDKRFTCETVDDDDTDVQTIRFSLLPKSDVITDIQNLLNAEASRSIH